MLFSGWQQIAHSSTRQWLSWFAHRFNRRMAADCSFIHSSTAFTTVFAPYFSADGIGLLILPLVNGFHDGLRAVLLCGWQRIAHTSACQWLSRWFSRRIALQIAVYCSFFRLRTALTMVCSPYCSADGIGLLNLLLTNCFHDDLCAAE